VPSPGDLSSPEVQAKLQVASVLKSIERYDGAPIGSLGLDEGGTDVDEIDRLSRQFGHRVIGRLSGMDVSIEEALKIATRVSGITIVLSDLINFSTLVASSTPDDLQEAMGRYYRLAREAVFRNGGMLDKFIGDSVLAVFGYPFAAERDTISAISFSLELVQIGGEVLGSWIDNLNHDIATGTRVGLATGEIWPINIGGPALEVALLGDTINLAARLEKNCGTNGLLMDQRTKAKAEKEDPAFTKGLGLVPKTIPVEAAKGQMAPVKAWGFAEVVHLADCK
jgi:adenylate cyclase